MDFKHHLTISSNNYCLEHPQYTSGRWCVCHPDQQLFEVHPSLSPAFPVAPWLVTSAHTLFVSTCRLVPGLAQGSSAGQYMSSVLAVLLPLFLHAQSGYCYCLVNSGIWPPLDPSPSSPTVCQRLPTTVIPGAEWPRHQNSKQIVESATTRKPQHPTVQKHVSYQVYTVI
jgi:hypothetical protein